MIILNDTPKNYRVTVIMQKGGKEHKAEVQATSFAGAVAQVVAVDYLEALPNNSDGGVSATVIAYYRKSKYHRVEVETLN